MKYFIINLSHRTDRWNKMLKQMESQKIQTFQRFDAIKPTWTTIEKEIKRLSPFFFKPPTIQIIFLKFIKQPSVAANVVAFESLIKYTLFFLKNIS